MRFFLGILLMLVTILSASVAFGNGSPLWVHVTALIVFSALVGLTTSKAVIN